MKLRDESEDRKRSGSSRGSRQLPSGISAQAVQDHVEKIVSSQGFVKSERLSRFLRFAVEKTLQGHADQLKEYLVAVEVFGRPESFDSRVDSIVRVEARRLRSTLEKYYETEGRDDPVVIDFPRGRYAPVFKKQEEATAAQARHPSAAPKNAIAVLPFENISPEKEQEYFCDGITEELINALTHLEGLRVVGRTSAFAFRRTRRDVRKIGEELNVGTLMEGTVRKVGKRLRITVQLINVADGYHLWSQRYDREMKDVFAIQEDISRAIVRALRVRLAGRQNKRLIKPAENLQAYNLFLKGLYYWHKQTMEDMKRGCQYFEQAVQTDPNYVPAHVGISDCYRLLGFWGALPPQEVMPKAKMAAVRALEIDDTIGEAHRALAGVKGLYDWDDWPGTERKYLRGVDLNPGDAITRQSYAIVYLAPMGRLDEAIEQMKVAEEIDPLSPFHCTIVGWALYLARQYAEAIEQCRKALELSPSFHLAHVVRGWACEQKSDFEEALAAFEKARSSAGPVPLVLSSLARSYALSDRRTKASKLLSELKDLSKERYVPPLEIAVIYAGLGQTDQALDWLEKAYGDRTSRLALISVDPRFDSLRSERRFTALLNKMGLRDSALGARA